jgi:cell division protein FtsL
MDVIKSNIKVIVVGSTGLIALYGLLVLICGPVRTKGYKEYYNYKKNFNNTKILKRDKRKLKDLKAFETATFVLDFILGLGLCCLLILDLSKKLPDVINYQIIGFTGLGFSAMSFIFQFAYIWLVGSIFYRHFYDAKYLYDIYKYNIGTAEFNEFFYNMYKKMTKTAKLMVCSIVFGILFLFIILLTGLFFYLYLNEEALEIKKNINNSSQKENNDNEEKSVDEKKKIEKI